MAAATLDEAWLRRTFELARHARQEGNMPFGSVLVSRASMVLAEGENTARSMGDPTGHAELNLLRGLFSRVDATELGRATLYASGEPCPMCAAAIAWAGIGRVVYSVPSTRLAELLPQGFGPVFSLRSRQVLESASVRVELEGSVLATEGERVFEGLRT